MTAAMITDLSCLSCQVRMVSDVITAHLGQQPERAQAAMRCALRLLAEADLDQPPPQIAGLVQRGIRHLVGPDPYRAYKDRSTALALDLLPRLRTRLAAAVDPLALALRLAAAGNLIDAGVHGTLPEAAICTALDTVDHRDLDPEGVAGFVQAAATAERILYLADNAGELVLDRLLIEVLGPQRVTLVLRGAPILNDATREDLAASGIPADWTVLDNGHDAPGTVLAQCRPQLRQAFAAADLVISKGQGNYETLSGCGRPVFFLFTVKCAAIAGRTGLPIGSPVASFAVDF